MIGLMSFAMWCQFWATLLQPEPPLREACQVVSLADWRRDHPGHGRGGWAA
jgi:hypothetical protein